MRSDAEFRLNKELEEHQVLFAQLADIAGEDEAFLADLVEGETGIFELIEKLDLQISEDEIVAEGAAKQAAKMADRKKAAENRIVRMKAAVKHALEIAKLTNHKTTISSWGIGAAPIKAIVLDEAEVPSKWWKAADPTIDQAGLTKHFRDAKKASDAAMKIKDEAERDAALKKVDEEFPPIPGVSVSSATTQITRR